MKNMVIRVGLAVVLVVALSGAGHVLSAPPEAGSDRMARKMKVLERIIDEVMEQSPNILVSGSGSTNSLLLDGYGALFTIDGSLTGGVFDRWVPGAFDEGLAAFYEAQSAYPAPPAPPLEPGDDNEDLRVPGSVKEMAESWETRREDERKKALERLAGLKVELTETLLDYGATLGELAADDRVVVAVFLGGFGYDGEGPESLVLEVQMRDLRQFAAGQLTLEQAITKVIIKEQ